MKGNIKKQLTCLFLVSLARFLDIINVSCSFFAEIAHYHPCLQLLIRDVIVIERRDKTIVHDALHGKADHEHAETQ